jgi:hypothetical protein
VEPSQGSLNGGVVLTIHGTGFDDRALENNEIEADGLPCEVLSVTPTQLTCLTSKDETLSMVNGQFQTSTARRELKGGQSRSLPYQQRGCVDGSEDEDCLRLSGRGILEERIALDEFGESMSGYGIPRTFSTINDRVNLIPTYHLASSNSVFSHDYVSMEAESGTVAMLDLRDQFFLYTQKDYRVSFEYRSDGDVTSCDSSEIEMSSEPIPSHDYIYDEIAYSATFSSELKDQTSCRVYEFVVDQLLRDHTECAQLCASHFACTHYEFHNNTYSPTCYAVDRTCDVTED